MKCSNCLREVSAINIAGECIECYSNGKGKGIEDMLRIVRELVENKPEAEKELMKYSNLMTMKMLNTPPKNLKVKFFEGKLIDIERQMNKFFEEEKIDKDRLIETKMEKTQTEWGANNSIMVIYS